MQDLILPIPGSRTTQLIQVKNDLITSNLLQIKEIEKFRNKRPDLSMNEAAIQWINHNAVTWRRKHPLAI